MCLQNAKFFVRLQLLFYIQLFALPLFAQQAGTIQDTSAQFLHNFLSRYVQLNSTTGAENEAGRYFANICSKEGLHVKMLSDEPGSINFIASLYPLEAKKPNIVLLNHIDVVEAGDSSKWTYPPFSGAIVKDTLWGRGSIDNKGMAAMQLGAVRQFIGLASVKELPFNVSILSVSGEEKGGTTGAALVADCCLNEINPVVVLGEGGSGVSGIFTGSPQKELFGIEINHKRILWLKLTLNLKSAGHGSVPSSQSANILMVDALGRLGKNKHPFILSSSAKIMFAEIGNNEYGVKGYALRNLSWLKSIVKKPLRKQPILNAIVSNTVAITNISNPGTSKNQIPQSVEVILDCRLLPETTTEDFIRNLKRVLDIDNLNVEILTESVKAQDSQPDAFYAMLENAIKKNNPAAAVAPILFPATNDNNYFRAKGIPAFGILPVYTDYATIATIHNFDERISLEAIDKGARVYRDFLSQILDFPYTSSSVTQTVRGAVTEKHIGLPLSGCVVIISNDTAVVSASQTNLVGGFRLPQIPLGRYSLKVFHPDYKEIRLGNILVHSGREVVLNVSLEEATSGPKKISLGKKPGAVNEMATVSTSTFDREETGRYPGSRDDPARMVASYAGVRGADDSRNDLIIRGNAPFGLAWRLEDIDIPNPNHFAIFGTSGGGVNLLNTKLLDRSDFYTGAFPAEFGNALSGVFDLRMRAGNNEKHEFTAEAGSLVTEFNAEGPLSKKTKSSYLLSLRNSTLGILENLSKSKGLIYARTFGVDAIPKYTDAAFKLHFPLKHNASISVFGNGGISKIQFLESQRDPCSFSYQDHGQDVNFGTETGVIGLNYLKTINTKTAIKITAYSSLSAMHSNRVRKVRDTLTNEIIRERQEYFNNSRQNNLGLSLRLTRQISARNTLKVGLTTETHFINFSDTLASIPVTNAKQIAHTLKSFIQWKHQLSNNLFIGLGMNGIHFSLNKSWSADPRLGLSWNISRKSTFGAAFGIHSQLQPMYLYFQQIEDAGGALSTANQSMGLTHSDHYVLNYDHRLTENLRFKVEAYFQNLRDIPVEVRPSAWSMVNQGLDFKLSFPGVLKNNGTAQNYGVELTLERTFKQQYYFLGTISLFESKYTGSDRIARNTDYNGRYIFNFVAGKEISIKKKQTLQIGIRMNLAGGRRHTPIDEAASVIAEKTIHVDSLSYTLQYKDYFRTDLKINYRVSTKKVTHDIGLDLINILPVQFAKGDDGFPEACDWFALSTRNILTSVYDPVSKKIRTEYQLGFLPVLYYRLHF